MFYFLNPLNLDPNDHFFVIKSTNHNGQFEYNQLPNIESMDLSKKSLIVLCGNDTNNDKKSARYSKHFFDWIQDSNFSNEVTSYSLFYHNGQPLTNSLSMNADFAHYFDALSNSIWSSIIMDNEQLLPTEQIIKNLSNIVFFGHSVGGLVMEELTDNLDMMLKYFKYKKDDINKIMSNVVFVAYAPYIIPNDPIKTICISPLYDSVGSSKKILQKLSKSENVTTSPEFDLKNAYQDCKQFYIEDYINYFSKIMKNQSKIVFMDKNTLNITPDLLYFDGIKEDHNLAGIVSYNNPDKNKTKAGEEMTEFMQKLFTYCFSTPRAKFNLQDIFNFATKEEENNNLKEQ